MPYNEFFGNSYVDSKRIIYTPSAFARKNLLHIQEIGELRALVKHKNRRNDLESFLFFTVNSGSGILNYGGVDYELRAGDCVFIDCSKSYFHETSDDLWSLSWVHFNGKSLASIYENYIEMGGKPCFAIKDTTAFKNIWSSLWETAASNDRIRDIKINEQISSLITLLCEEGAVDSEQGASRRDVIDVRDYINAHYTEKITLDSLAERFFINKYYLTRIFKEQFGVTINQYITQMRITDAKRALRFSDESVESIGYNCGIGAPYYFSRIFKRVEGVSPAEFRKKWQKK